MLFRAMLILVLPMLALGTGCQSLDTDSVDTTSMVGSGVTALGTAGLGAALDDTIDNNWGGSLVPAVGGMAMGFLTSIFLNPLLSSDEAEDDAGESGLTGAPDLSGETDAKPETTDPAPKS